MSGFFIQEGVLFNFYRGSILTLKAPFPWFGGKSRAADIIWDRFGDVANYVEPFAGSLAVLLARPHNPGTETVNDLDCYLANFWRAVSVDADSVASFADWPVNEADLLARHQWLVAQVSFRDNVRNDPDYYDTKIAGWWAWGLCSWIGSGWCRQRGDGSAPEQIPHLGDAGRKLPHLGDAGRVEKRPHLANNGKGINAARGLELVAYFRDLQERLRRVRVACGEWHRVLGESVTVKHGVTAVLLDPPYDTEREECYSVETNVSADVRKWAVENGGNPMLRIAVCGYDTEHDLPGWECVPWKARGGYGSQSDGRGRKNSKRERIWFSPHCLKADLFSISHTGAPMPVQQGAS
jgi:DNA adenine methylase